MFRAFEGRVPATRQVTHTLLSIPSEKQILHIQKMQLARPLK